MKTALRKAYEERFGEVEDPFILYDSKGNEIYWENHEHWCKWERDSKRNMARYKDSDGHFEEYKWPRDEYTGATKD
jgi:hypothetical protein